MEMSLEKIGIRLKKGELIIYPTDTVYGVGGVLKEDTLKKIYEAKTRSFSSPLIALVNSLDKVDEIAIISDEHREKINKLIKRFWPGGLTIILKKRENVPAIMVSNGETVGVRMPNHKLALDIIESAGGILATTSANISGEATPSSFVEISPIFKERVDIVIDGGKCPIGTASTIIDMSKSKISILREGSISKEEIENIIGKI
ncbi:L-threonylcarbamoyladenylate synthase [Fusobacterium perfoetens]|uniref:L-threonylcarbamoyladenylate synthase n=1 Tax=Fusobacterium perfoetens TaxID=852 RepID=UPI001F391400|nr:L-threonylcarbamoyladenylate synthase [Fusobacterium perfoetens]MCF2612249.1 threonylcarbamoyl-AMP synthase [Fusobacterium perfoetens]